MALDPTFVYGNYVESGLWAALGVAALVRRNCTSSWVLGTTLIVFGASDCVEAGTGAWYSPWWLLAWKASCVAVILASGLRVLAVRRRRLAAVGGG